MRSLTRIGLGTVAALSLFSGMAMAADDNGGEAGIVKSCKWDIVKYAATAKKGEIKATLLKNIAKVSPDCKKAIDAAK